ncbi:hypothetical protein CEUSTIGMA_g13215.t1 [Chlamydomonas eustigma]|uniref:EF-hand domain-containing protein n=1 Tax=Chlamydomonas eustigma TaxID=1157962 RepID=A0A250XSM0_9CHLO|nr:hypothetical protein CEUSTIGMA_g13215.t1 [Chlamydomonas eustigma]|eukprot:GAX85800.1 hypothetical protein CEUSTIGMA_g13215.t1 [Chlamydomonas eustigma]
MGDAPPVLKALKEVKAISKFASHITLVNMSEVAWLWLRTSGWERAAMNLDALRANTTPPLSRHNIRADESNIGSTALLPARIRNEYIRFGFVEGDLDEPMQHLLVNCYLHPTAQITEESAYNGKYSVADVASYYAEDKTANHYLGNKSLFSLLMLWHISPPCTRGILTKIEVMDARLLNAKISFKEFEDIYRMQCNFRPLKVALEFLHQLGRPITKQEMSKIVTRFTSVRLTDQVLDIIMVVFGDGNHSLEVAAFIDAMARKLNSVHASKFAS